MDQQTEAQIEACLSHFNDPVANLAREIRSYLIDQYHPTTELVGDSALSLNIGYGFTEKAWDCFCAIIVYSKHINLSLPAGAFLNDPDKLLIGKGSKIRHIKVKKLDDLKIIPVHQILTEARSRAWKIAELNDANDIQLKTIIKPIAGVKRRSK